MSAAQPARAKRRGRWLHLGGLLLLVGLLVVNLLLVGYLSRGLWLEPLVRQIAVRQLESLLDAEVELEAIGGNWIDSIEFHGFSLRAESGPLRDVREVELKLGFDLPALLRGEPTGLRALSLRAERIELWIPATDPEAESEPLDLDALESWLDALPGGASIEIDHLGVRHAETAVLHDGPASLSLFNPDSRRLLMARLDRGQIELSWRREPELNAQLGATIDRPGELLAALGISRAFRNDQVEILARIDPYERTTRGRLHWSGEYGTQGESKALLDFETDERSVTGAIDVDLPGLRIEGDALRIPLLARSLDELRGALSFELRGRGPWESLLPDLARSFLPAHGRLRAHARAGHLQVARGRLRGAGWSVDIADGELPLTPDAGDRGRLSLSLGLEQPRLFPIEEGIELLCVGQVHGEIEGSLSDADIHARLDLQRGSCAGWHWESVQGAVDFDDGRLDVSELEIVSARPDGQPAADGIDYQGRFAVSLPADPNPLGLELDGVLTAASLAGLSDHRELAGFSPGSVAVVAKVALPDGTAPTGSASVEFEQLRASPQRQPSNGRASLDMEAEADGGSRFRAYFDGALDPVILRFFGIEDSRLERLAHATVRAGIEGRMPPDRPWPPAARAEVAIDGLTQGEAAPLQGAVRVSLVPEPLRLDIEQMEFSGPLRLDLRGRLSFDSPDSDLLLRVAFPESDPLTPLIPALPAGVRLDAKVAISGALQRPDVDGQFELRVRDPQVLIGDWPKALGPLPEHGIECKVDAALQGGVLDLRRITATLGEPDEPRLWFALGGSPPFEWTGSGLRAKAGGEPLRGAVRLRQKIDGVELAVNSQLAWDEDSLRLDDLDMRSQHGEVKGSASIERFHDALLDHSVGAASVGGELTLADFDLSSLPRDWGRADTLQGRVSGQIRLTGTIDGLLPTGSLTLAQASLKLNSQIPTIDELSGTVRLGERGFELEDMTGRMGLGHITIDGRITTPESPWPNHLDRAAVDLSVKVDDALLLRSTGLKLRANANVTAKGDFEDLLVQGDVEIAYGKLIRRVSLVPDFGRKGGTGLDNGIELFKIPPPLGRAIRFNVGIRTRQPIDVVTHVVNAPVDVSLRLLGTGINPRLEGTVSATSGVLRMPVVAFTIDQALLTFRAEQPRFPMLQFNASARRHSIDLTTSATGSIDSVEVLLSSVPPLTQSELFVLASTGALPERLRDQGLAGQATMIGGYLATEIFDFYFGSDSTEGGAGFVDRFHFHTGREISSSGTESMAVDFDLDDTWALRAERDMYEDYNMGVVYRIRF